MILVDVYSPAASRTWDIVADEHAEVRELIPALTSMISVMLYGTTGIETTGFSLYSVDDHYELPMYMTLSECGIMDGQRLLLI